MMLVRTAIRNSSIEGVGLFATSFIPNGTIIWKLDERFDLVYPANVVASFRTICATTSPATAIRTWSATVSSCSSSTTGAS